ncbi:helix-turn-helix domain-containing protein [Schleiferilactobacillus shenzhenensis]|nr:helix-turn-helix transcriptional regulator [Schleiferilactobacillus shenzhenensis]
MELGEFFRQQRLDNHLTIHQVAGGIVSDSMLSRFERGESDISAKLYFQLLTRLDANVEDLQNWYIEHDQNNPFAFANMDGTNEGLRKAAVHFQQLYEKTGWRYYQLSAISYMMSYAKWHPERHLVTQEMTDILLRSLLSLKTWGNFDIGLITPLVASPYVTTAELKQLLPTLVQVTKQHAASSSADWRDSSFVHLVAACQQLASALMPRQCWDEARSLISMVDGLPIETSLALLHNQTKIRLLLAYHDSPSPAIDDDYNAMEAAWIGTQFEDIGAQSTAAWKRFKKAQEISHDN